MPRYKRAISPTGFYHVVARGNGRQTIFYSDADRRIFLKYLEEALRKYQITNIAWCLMSNHVHLLLRDNKQNLSKAIQLLLGKYASYFNKANERVGHLFQDRFSSSAIESDRHLLETVQYIHNNPERAGICLAEEYPWSSYSEYLCGPKITNTEFILGMVGGTEQLILFTKSNVPTTNPYGCSRKRVSDNEARNIATQALRRCGMSIGPEEIKCLSNDKRIPLLSALRMEGLSVRQIERLTGIGRYAITKATAIQKGIQKGTDPN